MTLSPTPTVTHVVLLLMLPLAFIVFSSMKPAKAAIVFVMLTVLYSPEGAFFKFPSVPELYKHNIPYLFMLVVVLIRIPGRFLKGRPGSGPELLIILGMFACLATVVTNPDSLQYGSWRTTTLPALNFNDGFAMAFYDLLYMGLPFILGRCLYRDSADLRNLAVGYTVVALTYAIPIYFELRMSPQLHEMFYGYGVRGEFVQVLRWGGYRPTCLLPNGLAVALVVMCNAMFACALLKCRVRIVKFATNKMVVGFLVVTVVLMKSTAVIMYSAALLPAILRFKVKTQVKIALVIGALALAYPALKAANLVPVAELQELFNSINKERGDSMAFRFENEEILLEKARERVWFGWGSYGRNGIYHDVTGRQMSVTDGYWTILIGVRGVAGLLVGFGIQLLPVWLIFRRWRRVVDPSDQRLLGAGSLILAISVADLIPNGQFTNYPYFLSGALWGITTYLTNPRTIRMQRAQRAGMPAGAAPPRKRKRRRPAAPPPPAGVPPPPAGAPPTA